MKFYVKLARLTREGKLVVVEAPDKEAVEQNLAEVYFKDDATEGWQPDTDWAPEEGDHEISDAPVLDADKVGVVLSSEGEDVPWDITTKRYP